jgi:hypothetical protein
MSDLSASSSFLSELLHLLKQLYYYGLTYVSEAILKRIKQQQVKLNKYRRTSFLSTFYSYFLLKKKKLYLTFPSINRFAIMININSNKHENTYASHSTITHCQKKKERNTHTFHIIIILYI